jgi:hypothetical protein
MVKFMADYSFRTGFFGKACAILNKRELPGNEQKTSAGETFCLVPLPLGHTCVGRARDVFRPLAGLTRKALGISKAPPYAS